MNLLSGTGNLLAGNEGAIYIEVLLTPGATLTGYENSVTATGTSPSGDIITDISTDGAEPDANGDGSPTDDMAATPIDFTETASAGIAKRVANITNNGDGSYTVLFEFNIENFGDVDVSGPAGHGQPGIGLPGRLRNNRGRPDQRRLYSRCLI